MESSKRFLCDECGRKFTKNKNQLRHIRTSHQGMERTDKKRKSDSQEIALPKIAKIDNTAEDTTPAEESTVEDNKPQDNTSPEDTTPVSFINLCIIKILTLLALLATIVDLW